MKLSLIAALITAFLLGNSAYVFAGKEGSEHKSAKAAECKHQHDKSHKDEMKKKVHKKMMKKIDTNEDGKIDETEYVAHAQKRFKKMDFDSDGFVTSEEMRKSHKMMRKKHHKMIKESLKADKETTSTEGDSKKK